MTFQLNLFVSSVYNIHNIMYMDAVYTIMNDVQLPVMHVSVCVNIGLISAGEKRLAHCML